MKFPFPFINKAIKNNRILLNILYFSNKLNGRRYFDRIFSLKKTWSFRSTHPLEGLMMNAIQAEPETVFLIKIQYIRWRALEIK